MKFNILKLSVLSFSLFFLFSFNSNAQITVDTLLDGISSPTDCEIDSQPDGGDCSLRDAIDTANGNAGADEIIFDGGLALPGTINLTNGQMTITDDLTITGPGTNMLTIDADDLTRIFLVDDSSDMNVIVVEIIGLRLINGFDAGFNSGAGIRNNENLTIESCNFENINTDGNGGAILNDIENALLTVRNSLFESNTAGNMVNQQIGGAAISNLRGTILEIVNSTFRLNSNQSPSNVGGAITNNAIINRIVGSTFQNNTSRGPGGAIYSNGDLIGEIIDTEFLLNTAGTNGGAISTLNDINLIDNCRFSENNTGSDDRFNTGGAINLIGENTIDKIRNSTFDGNQAVGGGAIYVNGSQSGGGNAELTEINNSTFNNNTADAQSLTVTDATSGSGGAILFGANTNTTNITNSTMSGNTATGAGPSGVSQGGAIHISATSVDPINISFTTISGNTADNRGGGIASQSISQIVYNIRNSIIATNTATDFGNNCEADYVDETMDETNNYSDDDTCGFDNDNSIMAGDLAASPAPNGGPTDTVELISGFAIDGASPDCAPLDSSGITTGVQLSTDQRYFTRPEGTRCDSGAFEANAAPLTVTINLTKISNPPGGFGFDFTGTGFVAGCDLQDNFMMNDEDILTCEIPQGDYTIDEDIPVDQNLRIVCIEGPTNLVSDNMTGETIFSVISPTDEISCVYINSSPNFLSLVTPEPTGASCEFGGVRVDTGFDDNGDGVLDPGEIDDTQFFCNTQPPTPPNPPAPGDDDDDDNNDDNLESLVDLNVEPAGSNCPNGGVRVDTGIDNNGDGILQASEIDDTNFICDDPPGVTNNNSDSDDSGCSLVSSGKTDGMDLLSVLLPFLMIPFIVFRRRKNQDS